MAARKKATRGKTTRKGGRRDGTGAWYDSNWFLLVLAVLVVAGVRVYQVREPGVPDEEPAEEPPAAVAAEEAPTAAPPPPAVEVAGSVAYRGMLHDEVVVPSVDRRSCPEHVAGMLRVTDGHLADALVWVEGVVGEPAAPSAIELHSQECQIEPRAAVAAVGATLRWASTDDVAHQYEARDAAGEVVFSVDLPAGGEATRTVSGAGVLQLTCQRHPWERASLLVADHGHAAVTDVDGRFQLGDVRRPAGDGRATLRVVHAQIDPHEMELDLATDQPLDVRVDLTERAL
jgi:plastocyanin